MPNQINEQLWLSNKLKLPSINSLNSILNFVLFWNLFEAKHFNYNYSPSRIDNFINAKRNSLANISSDTIELINFFKTRYYTGNAFTHHFNTLQLRTNDNRQLIEDVMIGAKNIENDIVKTIITIIGRFRNNLFHGLKDPHEIVCQNELFSFINSYLSLLIDL